MEFYFELSGCNKEVERERERERERAVQENPW